MWYSDIKLCGDKSHFACLDPWRRHAQMIKLSEQFGCSLITFTRNHVGTKFRDLPGKLLHIPAGGECHDPKFVEMFYDLEGVAANGAGGTEYGNAFHKSGIQIITFDPMRFSPNDFR